MFMLSGILTTSETWPNPKKILRQSARKKYLPRSSDKVMFMLSRLLTWVKRDLIQKNPQTKCTKKYLLLQRFIIRTGSSASGFVTEKLKEAISPTRIIAWQCVGDTERGTVFCKLRMSQQPPDATFKIQKEKGIMTLSWQAFIRRVHHSFGRGKGWQTSSACGPLCVESGKSWTCSDVELYHNLLLQPCLKFRLLLKGTFQLLLEFVSPSLPTSTTQLHVFTSTNTSKFCTCFLGGREDRRSVAVRPRQARSPPGFSSTRPGGAHREPSLPPFRPPTLPLFRTASSTHRLCVENPCSVTVLPNCLWHASSSF